MPGVSTTARPYNPLRSFQFRLRVDPSTTSRLAGGYVAGVRSVSGLSLQVSPFEVWEGGNNLHRYANPNKITWEPIVLEQGLALDDTLERWARAVLELARTGRAPAEAVKRDLIIEVWDPYAHPSGPSGPSEGQSRSYLVHNAWVSKYHAIPKLDAMASEVALLSVELIHEGWELMGAAAGAPAKPLPTPPV